jgi:long-chain acyl-CoA synthetase
VGVPDSKRGERVVAVVVRADATLTQRQILDHCLYRLVDYQRPTTIVFMDALPRNALGKVLRKALQEQLR